MEQDRFLFPQNQNSYFLLGTECQVKSTFSQNCKKSLGLNYSDDGFKSHLHSAFTGTASLGDLKRLKSCDPGPPVLSLPHSKQKHIGGTKRRRTASMQVSCSATRSSEKHVNSADPPPSSSSSSSRLKEMVLGNPSVHRWKKISNLVLLYATLFTESNWTFLIQEEKSRFFRKPTGREQQGQ